MSEDSGPYKRRVTPNLDLPRLAPRLEKKLAPADEASAKGYDALEVAGERMEAMADAISAGTVSAEIEATDSLVYILTKADRERPKAEEKPKAEEEKP